MGFPFDEMAHVLTAEVEQLHFEVTTLWQQFTTTDWYGNNAHFPNAHYGYMAVCFARIDLMSRYWRGGDRPQTPRMIDFMDRYLQTNKRKEHEVAVQMWRHTLMHTAQPRRLRDRQASRDYVWLIYFGDWLPFEQHYTFRHDPHQSVLCLGITYFVDDLKRATARYLDDLRNDPALQRNFGMVHQNIAVQSFR